MLDFHENLLELRKKLGYFTFDQNQDGEGFCVGFSMVGAQTFILQKALERAALEKPELEENIELSKENQFLRFIKRLKFIGKYDDILPNLIRESRNKLKEQPNVNANVQIKDKNLEVASFFDEMEGYQNSSKYRGFFGRPIDQNQIAELAYYFQPLLLEKQGGLIEIKSFLNIYNFIDLQKYTRLLHEFALSEKTDQVFQLASDNHRISICFDEKQSVWYIIDANKVPIHTVSTSNALVDEILSSFELFGGKITAFNTKFITSGNRQEEKKLAINKLLNDKEFIELHQITLERAKMVSERGVDLAFMAAKNNDLHTLEELSKFKTTEESFVVNFNKVKTSFVAAQNGYIDILKFLATLKNIDGTSVVDFNQMMDNISLVDIAVQTGYVDVLTFLATLENPPSFTRPNKKGVVPVMVAAIQGHVDVLQLFAILEHLLGTKAIDFNQTLPTGETLAFAAAQNGRVEVLKFLARFQPPSYFAKPNKDGVSPVLIAAIQGHVDVLQFFANFEDTLGTAVIDFSQTWLTGETLAFAAAQNGRVDVLKFLARFQPSSYFTKPNKNGISPVLIAAANGHVDVLQLFATLEHPPGMKVIDFNQTLPTGETLVFVAAQNDQVDVLKFLATFQPLSYFTQPNKDGIDPVLIATAKGCVNVLRFFSRLENSAGVKLIDFNQVLPTGENLAVVAIQEGRANVLRFFGTLENPPSFTQLNKDGIAPIFTATAKGHVNVLRFLSKLTNSSGTRVIDFNQVLPTGESLVFIAAQFGRVDVLKFFARCKNPPNFTQSNKDGLTPILIATAQGHVDVLQLFATLGDSLGKVVDFNQVMSTGASLVFIAVLNGRLNVLKFLATLKDSNGKLIVDFEKPARDGVTPQAVAIEKGYVEIVDFLEMLKRYSENVSVRNFSLFPPTNQTDSLAEIQYLSNDNSDVRLEN